MVRTILTRTTVICSIKEQCLRCENWGGERKLTAVLCERFTIASVLHESVPPSNNLLVSWFKDVWPSLLFVFSVSCFSCTELYIFGTVYFYYFFLWNCRNCFRLGIKLSSLSLCHKTHNCISPCVFCWSVSVSFFIEFCQCGLCYNNNCLIITIAVHTVMLKIVVGSELHCKLPDDIEISFVSAWYKADLGQLAM